VAVVVLERGGLLGEMDSQEVQAVVQQEAREREA
jgi:hypothetical protein